MRPAIFSLGILTFFVASTVCASGIISVQFLTDHRIKFHGTVISVKGIVQETITGEKACPSCPPCPPDALCKPCALGCAQPRIFLVDALDPNSPRLMVILREGDEFYSERQEVVIAGKVEAGSQAVILYKIYE